MCDADTELTAFSVDISATSTESWGVFMNPTLLLSLEASESRNIVDLLSSDELRTLHFSESSSASLPSPKVEIN